MHRFGIGGRLRVEEDGVDDAVAGPVDAPDRKRGRIVHGIDEGGVGRSGRLGVSEQLRETTEQCDGRKGLSVENEKGEICV